MVPRLILFFLIAFIPQTAFANYAEFNGSTSYASIPTDTAMSVVPLVFYAQIKPTSLSSSLGDDQVIFSKLNTAGATYELTIDAADDKIHFRTNVGGSGGVNIVDNTAITVNNFYHILVYIDGSRNVSMYVNSTTAEASTGTSSALDTTGAGNLMFGGRGEGDGNFQGNFYMFRINAISISQIVLASAMTGLKQGNGLIHEISFWEDEGNYLYNTQNATYDGTTSNITHHVRYINYEIPEEHNYKYHPMEMTGTMWDNMGISREVEPYAHGDYSWAYNTRCDEPQYRKLHIATTGNDTTGDGSEGNPYLTTAPIVDQYLGIGEYGDCVIIHAGTYIWSGVGLSIKNYISNPGSYENRFIFTGAGDGETIIRFDKAHLLNWTAVDANIYKADWIDDVSFFLPPGNIVIDDNWPYGSRRVWSYADIVRDGDWFWDNTQNSTTTGAASGKLIDSTADFGNETPNPTEVGDVIRVPSLASGNFVTMITAIDSPTQLTVNDAVPSGVQYYVNRDLYLHTSGIDPDNRNLVIPWNTADTDSYGFNLGGAEFTELYGLTLIGAGTYGIGGFTSELTKHVSISHIVGKYNGRGLAALGKYNTQDYLVSFGNGILGHGNGTYGIGKGGTGGGWPSVCGCRTGCIVAWSFGEAIGGQADPITGYGDGRLVEDSIFINAWSVNLYSFDVTLSFTGRNNIAFNHSYHPTWTIPASEIANRGMNRGAIWRRMFAFGFLMGEEIAAVGQTEGRMAYGNIHDNIFINTRGCFDFFKEISIPLGMNRIDYVHNICISPAWDGGVMGAGWSLFEYDKIVGGTYNRSSRIYNNIFIGLNPNAYFSLFNENETYTNIDGVHTDYNYYIFQNPRAFNWLLDAYDSFSAYKTASGQDAHSQIGTVDDYDVINSGVIGRTDWGADVLNLTIDDLTPPADSYLINTGTLLLNEGGTRDLDFQLDFDKRLRPLHGTPDIGPLEYGEWYPKKHSNGNINGGSF